MALCVYDKKTSQQSLEEKNCGLGILRPSKMTTFEEENGDYSLSIEYPMTDQDMMWTHLSPYAIVRNSEDQLFTIHTCGTQFSGGRAVWKAEASHISYYLADKLVVNCVANGVDCHTALNEIWNHTKRWEPPGPAADAVEYDFSFSSDRVYRDWKNISYHNISPLSAILGTENSILSLYGGSIHRDNFRISFNEYKEKSRNNAFSIVHGLNMIEIRERICCKDYVTSTTGSDNYGNTTTLWGKHTSVAPHEILKSLSFSYSNQVSDNMKRLHDDVEKYGVTYGSGLDISYEVKFKDLKNIDKYKEWAQLQSYKIGDTGVIRSERLGIDVTAKIISRTINDITGETESITLGNFAPSLWRNDRFGIVSSNKRLKALEDLRIYNMFTWEAD